MKYSNILNGSELIQEKDWKKYITKLQKTPFSSNKTKLKQSLIAAVQDRLPQTQKSSKRTKSKNPSPEKFGIFFSGGVDSSTIALLCKQLTKGKRPKKEFICYSVGIENSEDVEWAKKVAKHHKFKLKTKIFTLKELEPIIKKVTKIIGEPNVVNVGVGTVVYAAAMLAKKDNITTFFGGLGSEEIFAGYQRHSDATDVHKECWKGLKGMHQRDLVRDYKIGTKLKIEALTPFLDPDLILHAMAINVKRKINTKYKKIILRQIAEELGLKKEFAWRKKRAAQYGSRFDKAIAKLAKKRGFKYKKEYLMSFLR